MSNEFQTSRRAPTALVTFVAAALTLMASQAGLTAAAAGAAPAPAAGAKGAAAALTTETDKTLYALGVLLKIGRAHV